MVHLAMHHEFNPETLAFRSSIVIYWNSSVVTF
jgi:hypothetical protein